MLVRCAYCLAHTQDLARTGHRGFKLTVEHGRPWHAAHRVWDSALVTEEPKVRFYAGAPLVASTGHRIGALCGPCPPGPSCQGVLVWVGFRDLQQVTDFVRCPAPAPQALAVRACWCRMGVEVMEAPGQV